jgi:hypothetical protein
MRRLLNDFSKKFGSYVPYSYLCYNKTNTQVMI